jgi:aminopeptidase C
MFEKYKKEFQKDLRRKNPFWLHPVSETTRPKKKKKIKKNTVGSSQTGLFLWNSMEKCIFGLETDLNN